MASSPPKNKNVEPDFLEPMRHRFSNKPFDENLLNVLLPHKDAWGDGHVDTPSYFASSSVCERAFCELLFCKSMNVNTDRDDQLTQAFLSLPAVRQCTLIRVYNSPRPLTVPEVVDWLSVDARSKEPKTFEIFRSELDESVENLVQQLKTVAFKFVADPFFVYAPL